MNPIPLSAPDGTVFTYACGVCRRIQSTGHMLVRHTDECVASIADGAKRGAEACCVCRACKAPLAEDDGFFTCKSCSAIQEVKNETARAVLEEESRARDAETRAKAKSYDAAICLRHEMSGISENTWCAGWMSGLEYMLWGTMVSDDPFDDEEGFGVLRFDRAKLRALSERAGGWWVWNTTTRFVTLEEWATLRQAKEPA
ncbi:MAG: hypothetical protein ACHREM_00380 [Polyangiales bacterium]